MYFLHSLPSKYYLLFFFILNFNTIEGKSGINKFIYRTTFMLWIILIRQFQMCGDHLICVLDKTYNILIMITHLLECLWIRKIVWILFNFFMCACTNWPIALDVNCVDWNYFRLEVSSFLTCLALSQFCSVGFGTWSWWLPGVLTHVVLYFKPLLEWSWSSR